MTIISFSKHMQENRIFQLLDRILLFTYPLFFIFGLFMFNRYLSPIHMNTVNILFLSVVLLLTLMIFQARAQKRDLIAIEKLIMQERTEFQKNIYFRPWGKYKLKYALVEALSVLPIILIPVSVIIYPNALPQKYVMVAFMMTIIIYVFIAGVRRLTLIKGYMTEVLNLYMDATKRRISSDMSSLFQYHYINTFVIAAIMSFVMTVIVEIVAAIDWRYICLFGLSVWVLCALGIGQFRARRMFTIYLKEIDTLRGIEN